MRKIGVSLLVVLFFTFCITSVQADLLEDQVFSPSINFEFGCSGTIFKAKTLKGNFEWYVISAGHCVEHLRKIVEVEEPDQDGNLQKKRKAIFDKTEIVQTSYKNRKAIGEQRLKCDVIAYSAAEEYGGFDVAVLKVVDNDILNFGAKFVDSDKYGLVGDDIVHIGNVYGKIMSAFCKGHIIKTDYFDDRLKTTYTVTSISGARPGSSGGGVFVRDTEGNWLFIGMVVRGDLGGLILVKPSNIIKQVLSKNKLEWIVE